MTSITCDGNVHCKFCETSQFPPLMEQVPAKSTLVCDGLALPVVHALRSEERALAKTKPSHDHMFTSKKRIKKLDSLFQEPSIPAHDCS